MKKRLFCVLKSVNRDIIKTLTNAPCGLCICGWWKPAINWDLAGRMFEKINIQKGLPCAKGGVMPLGVTEGLFQKVTKCKNNPPVALRRQPRNVLRSIMCTQRGLADHTCSNKNLSIYSQKSSRSVFFHKNSLQMCIFMIQ